MTQHNKLLTDGDMVMVGADCTTSSGRAGQKGCEPGAPLRPRSGSGKPLSGEETRHRLEGLEGSGVESS